MFLDFYGLREQPFGDTPDTRFLYLSRVHREALAALYCGIEAGRGFLGLIAAPGLGKTTLLFQLLARLQGAARVIFLSQTKCEPRDFLCSLVHHLGVKGDAKDLASLHLSLEASLDQERVAGRRCVLLIDEAHNLEESVLETVRLLSDFETPQAKKLQIVLSGQPRIAEMLARPAFEQLRQRFGILSRLGPLSREETRLYIEHRLQVAGHEGESLFDRSALGLIAEASHGVPRNINNICFSSLALGYAAGRKKINAAIVEEAVADLDGQTLAHPPNQLSKDWAVPARATQFGFSRNRWMQQALPVAGSLILAAALIVGFGYTFSTSRWLWGRWFEPAAPAVVQAETPDPASGQTGRESGPQTPQLDVEPQTATNPSVAQGDDSTPRVTVVVEPRQTLRQICLRNLGRYNESIVGKIRELNPWMSDPNYLEVGQRVQLPLPIRQHFEGNPEGRSVVNPKTKPAEKP